MTDAPLTYADLDSFGLERIGALAAHPKKIARLEELGIASVLDLITTYPRRHIDRSRQEQIRDLLPGDQAMVVARVKSISSRRTRGRPPKTLVTAEVGDGSGILRISFFNQGWRERQLPVGTEAVFFGKVDVYGGRKQMANPVVDMIGDRTGRIIALYPQSEKPRITSEDMATWILIALDKTEQRGIADPLPEEHRRRWDLPTRAEALRSIHAPDAMADVTRARTRLVLDELLRVQVALVRRKRALEQTVEGIRHDLGGDLVGRFVDRLPYGLTGAQSRVIDEIRRDMGRPSPMHRLLQGDVGAGKTVVAVSALLTAVEGGHQGALMAPTEVLAEQHALGIGELLSDLRVAGDADAGSLFEGTAQDRPLRVELLTNRTTAAARRTLAAGLLDGSVDILIGTHALIEDAVAFRSLGAVVIDEQHRFGVEQRDALRRKGPEGLAPDVLVMTATPIPRTAAMTVYGDLDVSILDELPPGRTPIETRWVEAASDDAEAQAEVWDHVRSEVAAGRQAYVVCPLVEESSKLEVTSAEETFERLAAQELSGLRLALLHGRMASADKESVMDAMRRGDIDVLVSTTVIEVGVDVPNATVMVILDADRFGIAQLHQLRGRVGRGSAASTCWLVGEGASSDGSERLAAMVRTTDGFELAEVDLDLRGEGTLMGDRQKGRNDLKLASLRRDRVWVERAREIAFEMLDGSRADGADPAVEMLHGEVDALLGATDTDYLLKS